MDPTELLLWLESLGFGRYTAAFDGYSGADLLGMDRSDMRSLFGYMQPKMNSDEKIKLQQAIEQARSGSLNPAVRSI